jgi:hypothetical protein
MPGKAATTPLPDEAVVVRGGKNLPENFVSGTGVMIDSEGRLQGASVNCVPRLSVKELTVPNRQTGHPGIPHKQIGVTTVGAVRACGGDVVPSPGPNNPYHATLGGITPEQASQLFRPTIENPNRHERRSK